MTSIKDLGAILEENGAEICVEEPLRRIADIYGVMKQKVGE